MPRTKTIVSGTCVGCGNDFSVALKCSTRPAPKYCSRECYKKYGMAVMRVKAYASLAIKWGAEEGHKAKRQRPCETCGKILDQKPSSKQRFCSRKCWVLAPFNHTKTPKGNCRRCGVILQFSPANNRQFCSMGCFYAWKKENPQYYWTSERKTKCKHCRKLIEAMPCQENQFCNQECFLASLRGKKRGDPLEPARGSLKWQRRFARALYNNACCKCGYNNVPEILQVHHKDHNPRNQSEDNIELLCPNCHEEDHFRTKTGRFGDHTRRGKKPYEETYNFKKFASTKRAKLVAQGLPDPGPISSSAQLDS